MHNLFNETDKNEIIMRIEALQPDSKPLWGKMNVSQMLAHCTMPVKVALGQHKLGHSLLGKLLGKTFKNKMLKEDYVFQRNLPTPKSFVVKETPDFHKNQKALKDIIQSFFDADKHELESRAHPFFGKMKADEWGDLGYKHLDHHLRQFGV